MSENKEIVFLNSKALPEIAEVGGKGYSLIKLSSLDLNVPNGIVLTVTFFNEWINKVKATSLYHKFLELLKKDNNSNDCSLILNQIKDWCLNNLTLTKENLKDIEKSLKLIFPEDYDKILYAVRSSSPEEDLSGASFAGNYETYLGIKFDSVEKYILKSFISCLDFRVIKYKFEKGFDASDVKIAIVVMKQINCDVSGVGFSINPLNNDYDEAVITSNFGLGESVVGGIITPDEYIINKLSKKIVSQKLGSKDKVVRLNENNNETSIIEQTEENKKQSSLTEELIVKIVESIVNIENHYEIPIDIEFGVENGVLYILQARPITTYNTIPRELLTESHEKRQLFFDTTIAIQGFDKPMSTLGSSVLKVLVHFLGKNIFGIKTFDDIRNSAADVVGGKFLLNLSNIGTKIPMEKVAAIAGNANTQLPELLLKYGKDYTNDKVCRNIDISLFRFLSRLPLLRVIFSNYFGQSSKDNFEKAGSEFIAKYEKYIKDNYETEIPVLDILKLMDDELTALLRDKFIPVMAPAVVKGLLPLNKIFEENFKDKPELKGDLNNLTKSLPYITVLMGLDLYKLTYYLDKNTYKDKSQDEFYQDFLDRKFPEGFYDDFEKFIKKYGIRGEGELDIINERYSENPRNLLNQIYSSLVMSDENINPQKDYDETNAKRPEILKKLKSMLKNKKDASKFEDAYQNVINFLYYRESHKYYIIFVISKVKELILKRCNVLLEKNLIDNINDIYKLDIVSLNDILQNVEKYSKEDIMNQMVKDDRAYKEFNSWGSAPLLFDSRGRIITAERKVSTKKNELIGDSVSFGKIRGKAKVLNSVNEKEFYPGDILITKATDPGWTPLIINCGGIVLEVGGMLQHGALVSREFNKPCVVGIDNVTKIIKDGEEVEVDAIEGVVRLLDREE